MTVLLSLFTSAILLDLINSYHNITFYIYEKKNISKQIG